MDDDRQPVYNLDAEESVLGSALIDDTAMPIILATLTPEDFYRDKNIWVMQAMEYLYRKSIPTNQITVANRLGEMDQLEALGGPAYLSNLVMNVPTSVHCRYYSEIVKNLSRRRDIIYAGESIHELGYTCDEADDAFTKALDIILQLKQEGGGGLRRIGDIAQEYSPEFFEWIESGFQPRGVLTGFSDLDMVLGGLPRKQLTLVAARPSMGKSQTIIKVADNCCRRGNPAAIFSLEMSKEQIIDRILFSQANISVHDVSDENVSSLQREAWSEELGEKFAELMNLDMWIDDTSNVKVQQAQVRLLQVLASDTVKVMFFDHLSLAGDERARGDNETQRISVISRGLKALAKICDVPVCVACQLNRDVTRRSDKRPWLEDLRDSGALEQDADIVLGLYRDNYYHPEGDPEYNKDLKDFLEVLVLKNRMGKANPRGGVRLGVYYDSNTGRMDNWLGEYPERGGY